MADQNLPLSNIARAVIRFKSVRFDPHWHTFSFCVRPTVLIVRRWVHGFENVGLRLEKNGLGRTDILVVAIDDT